MAVEGVPTRDEVLQVVYEGDGLLKKAKLMAEQYTGNARDMIRTIGRKNGNT
jgi:hypothetical protein